jgi:surface antigen
MRATPILLTACLAFSLPAAAVNWNFLQYGPAGQFTDEDWEQLRQAGRGALDSAADGETRSWNNTATGASGTVRPLDTYQRDGSTCRRAEVFNSAGDASATTRFDFCKQPDGSWKIAPRQAGSGGSGASQ